MWFWMKQQTKVRANGPPECAWSRRTAVADYRVCVCTYISSLKDQRVAASKVLSGPQHSQQAIRLSLSRKFVVRCIGQNRFLRPGLLSAACCVWRVNWDLNYGEIAKIFRAGCIILRSSCRKSPMLMPKIRRSLTAAGSVLQANRRWLPAGAARCVAYAVQNGIPVPTFAAAVAFMTATVPLFCLRTWSRHSVTFRCAYL